MMQLQAQRGKRGLTGGIGVFSALLVAWSASLLRPPSAPVHAQEATPEAGGRDARPEVSDGHPDGYTLVFADEFEGTDLDRGRWCTRYAYGGGPPLQVLDHDCTGPDGRAGSLDFLNDEQQRYVDVDARGSSVHVVSEGTLKLRADKTRDDERAPYQSAMIRSKRTFVPSTSTRYYVTARLRLPSARGTWPAMWLAAALDERGEAQWPPEIDVFEGALNGIDDRETMLHMGAQVRGGMQTVSGKTEITYSNDFDATWGNHHAQRSLRDTWLEIAAEWTDASVCYFVDGARIMCENYRWVDDQGRPAVAATLLINLAVGGAWAGRYGIDDTRFPTQLEVDHVRVYARGAAEIDVRDAVTGEPRERALVP